MLATIGLAVALGRSAPPDDGVVPSRTEAVIGYDLAGPPTLARLLFDWRFNLLFGSAALVLAAIYLLGCAPAALGGGDTWGLPAGRPPGSPAARDCPGHELRGSGGTARRCSARTWPST